MNEFELMSCDSMPAGSFLGKAFLSSKKSLDYSKGFSSSLCYVPGHTTQSSDPRAL